MKKILTAIVSVSIFIVGILLILCADTNFLWYAFNQNVRLTVVAGILIALATDFRHNDCLFYMPGFWYRRNLRSPKEAPSFHTSDSWIVSVFEKNTAI